MILLTSPAKLMNVENARRDLKTTTPLFIEEAAELQAELKTKSPQFLRDLMDISAKLADENWHRNQNWSPKPSKKEAAPAIFAFTGEVYRGLDAESLDEPALKYLQKHYRILSGLYGLLRPSDRIMLYRLEMGRKFAVNGHANLYGFWKEKITAQLNSELKKNDFILNLASQEYIKVLDQKKLHAPLIDFDFYDYRDGSLRAVTVYIKHARGLMVRFCAENQIKDLDALKGFNLENYLFDEKESTDTRLVFIR